MNLADQLQPRAEVLVAQILSDPRPVASKLSSELWTITPQLDTRPSPATEEPHPPSDLLAWSEDFLLSLPSYRALLVFILTTLNGSKVRSAKPPESLAHSLLYAALTRASGASSGGATIYRDLLIKLLDRLLAAMSGGSVEFTLCRRLIGVDMQVPRMELSESVQLVKLSEQELAARMPPLEFIEHGLVTPDLAPVNKVEVRVRRSEALQDYETLTRGPTRPRILLRDSERVQEAILLMAAEGQVELGSYQFQATDPPLGNCLAQPLNYTGSGIIFPPMLLRTSDIPQLQKCFDVAQRVQAFPPLKSALHRYTLACLRSRAEDSLVDLVIGFESLLLQGLQNELSHRFSLNGSSLCHWILGKPRKESYHLFRSAYAARSSVVHGYGRKNQATRMESLSNELRHLLADFLMWLILDAPRFDLKPRLEAEDWLRLLFESPPPIDGAN